MRIGEYFLKIGKIKKRDLDIALNIQKLTKKPLGKILIELGFINHLDLINYLSVKNKEEVVKEKVITTKIDIEELKKYLSIIISESPDTLFIASLKVKKAKEYFEKKYNKKVEIVPLPYTYIINKLKFLEKFSLKILNLKTPKEYLEFVLTEAILEGASDIHISPLLKQGIILFRKDGVRIVKYYLSSDAYESLVAYIKQMGEMDISLKNRPQDGAFTFNIGNKYVDVRVSTLPTVFKNQYNLPAENVVMRILDRDTVIKPLETIGFEKEDLERWKRVINQKQGLILVCGATGSGKTTTIYSTLLSLDRIGMHITTVENPVEFRFPFITQVEVTENLTFKSALRAFLRQDPDVILVGEVRDEETAELMLQACETGHLVFATLHASDLFTVIDRLKELKIKVIDLKYILKAVCIQTLAKKVCKVCKGEGCLYCSYTGYKGRILLYELLVLNEKIFQKLLTLKEKGIKYEEALKELNIKSIREKAKKYFEKGIIDKKEYEKIIGV